jgi:hypothetical protein
MILPCGQDDTFFMIGLSENYPFVFIRGICGDIFTATTVKYGYLLAFLNQNTYFYRYNGKSNAIT